jgi:phosphoribosylformimino-5-aminoimidazole carboxamide ribotide isomerase
VNDLRVIPAVDLLDRRLARLSKGDVQTAKYYQVFGDPVQAALHWEKQGAKSLHVVDLDAAMGRGNNRLLIHRILSEVRIPVQVGGGLRSPEDVMDVLNKGASRAIIGTFAFENPSQFRQMIISLGCEKIVVALDYIENRIVTRAWQQKTELTLEETLRSLIGAGAKIFLLTAVARDGLLSGPDLENLSRCTRIPGARIIAAGGVAGLRDLENLAEIGVDEAIVGKALYEQRFTLEEVLALFPD